MNENGDEKVTLLLAPHIHWKQHHPDQHHSNNGKVILSHICRLLDLDLRYCDWKSGQWAFLSVGIFNTSEKHLI